VLLARPTLRLHRWMPPPRILAPRVARPTARTEASSLPGVPRRTPSALGPHAGAAPEEAARRGAARTGPGFPEGHPALLHVLLSRLGVKESGVMLLGLAASLERTLFVGIEPA